MSSLVIHPQSVNVKDMHMVNVATFAKTDPFQENETGNQSLLTI